LLGFDHSQNLNWVYQMIKISHRIVIASLFVCLAAPVPALAADAPLKQFAPGDVPPAALGTTRSGDDIVTSQFAGKVLVVTFWASWCAPCRAEMGMLERLQVVAGKDRLQVVAVNIEEREKFRSITKALSNLALTLTNDPKKHFSAAYGVRGIPHMVIIGKDGKVINVHRGYGESSLDGLLVEINAALAGAAPKAEPANG
jgi:thiol-disulfide isomerase/thioredoxin